MSRPSSRIRSIADTVEPPVVTVSSTTRTFAPSSTGPSTQRWSPCCFRSLRTKNPTRSSPPGTAIAAQASGIAAITGPPTATAPASVAAAAISSPGGAEAGRAHDRPARVDVVLRGLPARERHLAQDQGVLAQLGDERLAGAVLIGAQRPALRVDVDVVAEVDPVVDEERVRDRVAKAPVAGRVVRHRRCTRASRSRGSSARSRRNGPCRASSSRTPCGRRCGGPWIVGVAAVPEEMWKMCFGLPLSARTITWRERSASTCLPAPGYLSLKLPPAVRERAEDRRRRVGRARHAVHLAVGEDRAPGRRAVARAVRGVVGLLVEEVVEEVHVVVLHPGIKVRIGDADRSATASRSPPGSARPPSSRGPGRQPSSIRRLRADLEAALVLARHAPDRLVLGDDLVVGLGDPDPHLLVRHERADVADAEDLAADVHLAAVTFLRAMRTFASFGAP